MLNISSFIKREPSLFLFIKMWRFAKGHRLLVVTFMLLSALANIVVLINPLLFGEFLNQIQKQGLTDASVVHLSLLLLGMVGLTLLFWMLHGPSRILEEVSAFKTSKNYQEFLTSGVLDLSLSWHNQRDSGETIDKITNARMALNRFSGGFFVIIEIIVRVFGTSAILLFFNIYIGLIVLGLVAVALVVIFQFDIRIIPLRKQVNIFGNKVSAKVFDALSNITSVKVLHIESAVFEGIKSSITAPYQVVKKSAIMNELKWFGGSMMFSLISVVPILFYILYLYANNQPILIGSVSTLYLYLSQLISVYYGFAGSYERFIQDKTRIQNAEDIEEAISRNERSTRKPAPIWQSIELRKLLFKYEDDTDENYQLKNIDFDLQRGEKVALIGASGSGKTTFLKVIHGLYLNASGTIRFDEGVVEQTSFADFDLKTTLVPQEPELFSASITENITLGSDYSQAEIEAACGLAEFTSVVADLPNGYNSIINEKGVNLSGGQKQRLALARALLFAKGKDMILLDESTSSVDPETESKIYQNIFDVFAGKAIIASIHKMNLLKFFDRIVIFSKGKIIDQGSFETLLQSNRRFAKEWARFVAHNRQP